MEQSKEYSVISALTEKLRKYISKYDATVFLLSFAIGMLVHLYMFTNKFINHDDVFRLYNNDQTSGIASGRWMFHIVNTFTGTFSSSWLDGVAGLICLSLAVLLVVKLFRFTHLIPAILAAVIMIAFPVVASTYSYMFCAFSYMFALLLSAAGAWFIRKGSLAGVILGGVLITISMGCYQVYFCLAAVLLVVTLAMDICDDRWNGQALKFTVYVIKCLAGLIIGMVLYLIVTKAVLWFTGIELTDYQGINSMGQITFNELIERVVLSYKNFFRFYQNDLFEIFHSFYPVFSAACMVVSLLMIACAVVTKKLYRQPIMMIYLVLLITVFPLASNLVYVMAEAWTVHTVMLYPLVMLLVAPCFAVDRMKFSDADGKKMMTGGVLLGMR